MMTYEDVKKIRANPTASGIDNKKLASMIDDAIDKQIAVKPIPVIRAVGKGKPVKTEYCGTCCYKLGVTDYYCRKCGQKADRSDTNGGQ